MSCKKPITKASSGLITLYSFAKISAATAHLIEWHLYSGAGV